jgi:hypothetical protein
MKIVDLLNGPALKKTREAGEQAMGRLVTQVLSSERIMRGVQGAISSALEARTALDRGVRAAMQAVNLPTTRDVEELRRRLAELETLLDGLAARIDGAPSPGGGRGGPDGGRPA